MLFNQICVDLNTYARIKMFKIVILRALILKVRVRRLPIRGGVNNILPQCHKSDNHELNIKPGEQLKYKLVCHAVVTLLSLSRHSAVQLDLEN